ncbi:MAG: adenylate/guanylate cyclase domain-containing protein [Acidimicrobiales bacterium]|nr:adenylate/guanylate cyclase domain-containing protein [Acidimicrobiales bacterium]
MAVTPRTPDPRAAGDDAAPDEDAVTAFREVGLYDPAAPGASDRLALLTYLDGLGVPLEAMAAADNDDELAALASDQLLRPAGELTLAELAARLGEPVDDVTYRIRATGLPVPAPDERAFSEQDVALHRSLTPALELLEPDAAYQVLRVIGSSLAQIAEAAVTTYLDNVERLITEAGGSELDVARRSVDGVGVLGGALDALGPLLVRHVGVAVERSRRARRGPAYDVFRLAIGFLDLVGFTPLSLRLSSRELGALVSEFESTARDLVAHHGGRVVKLVGDEVMFVAVDTDRACDIALDLLDVFREHQGITPRGGVAVGDLLTRHGDYYGPVVNLAARISDHAVPDEVLVTTDVRDDLAHTGAPFTLTSAGRRMLKGFDEPVPLWTLTRAGATDDR